MIDNEASKRIYALQKTWWVKKALYKEHLNLKSGYIMMIFLYDIITQTNNEVHISSRCYVNGSLARYVKVRVAYAPGMSGTFSPPLRVRYPDMYYSTCMTHLPWCMPGSLTSGFLWSRWWGKRSRHSRRRCKQQFYVSGKRPIVPNTLEMLLMFDTKPYAFRCQPVYEIKLNSTLPSDPGLLIGKFVLKTSLTPM